MEEETCPKCGGPHDPKHDDIIECPECHTEGSTACCNAAGNNCPCVDCENKEDEEEPNAHDNELP